MSQMDCLPQEKKYNNKKKKIKQKMPLGEGAKTLISGKEITRLSLT